MPLRLKGLHHIWTQVIPEVKNHKQDIISAGIQRFFVNIKVLKDLKLVFKTKSGLSNSDLCLHWQTF